MIKFFYLKQKKASTGNIMFSVPLTYRVAEYYCSIRHSATSATHTQPEITCSKLTIETLEQGVKYVQS